MFVKLDQFLSGENKKTLETNTQKLNPNPQFHTKKIPTAQSCTHKFAGKALADMKETATTTTEYQHMSKVFFNEVLKRCVEEKFKVSL